MIKVILKIVRRINRIINPEQSKFGRNWYMFSNKEYSSELIREILLSDRPAMIARLGSTELSCMTNYLGVKNPEKYKNIKSFVRSQSPEWWWNKSVILHMKLWSGFFPSEISKLEQFCELMMSDLHNVDVLGSWLKSESFFSDELSNSKKVMLEDLEPFFIKNPWTEALKGKKVLVVHPFAETIKSQYARKDKVFPNGLLPDFELQVVPAVQSIAGENPDFTDWFEALESMKNQIANHDFDVCILGCGAYGFPLAAYVKSLGKKAIHLGGITQMLFGIKGARWEEYIVYPYENLMNEYWVRPGESEKPKDATKVEGGCYW